MAFFNLPLKKKAQEKENIASFVITVRGGKKSVAVVQVHHSTAYFCYLVCLGCTVVCVCGHTFSEFMTKGVHSQDT